MSTARLQAEHRNAWENQDNAGYLRFTSHCWCFALGRDNWKEDLWHLIVYCWTGLSETASTGQLISSGVVKVELMGLIAETGCEGAQLKCSMLFLIGRQTEIKTWFKVWARACFPVSLFNFTFLVIRPALIHSVCVFLTHFVVVSTMCDPTVAFDRLLSVLCSSSAAQTLILSIHPLARLLHLTSFQIFCPTSQN